MRRTASPPRAPGVILTSRHPAQLVEQIHVGAGLVGSQRDQHRDRQLREPSREEVERAQRRTIAPVHVVDREQERPLGCQLHSEPVDRAHRGKTVSGDVRMLRGGRCRLEQLADQPERMVTLEFAAARREDGHAGRAGLVTGEPEERALACSRGSLDDQQRTASRARAEQGRVERLDCALTVVQLPSGYPHST